MFDLEKYLTSKVVVGICAVASVATLSVAAVLTSPDNLKPERPTNEIKYKTSFGGCPARAAGTLTLKLSKVFDETHSLRLVKKKIVEENLSEKHFLSSYKIKYDVAEQTLQFDYQCPEPLMKVQLYKDDGKDSYEAILVSDGKLVDPLYEKLLKEEGKITGDLPYLALPVGEMEQSTQLKITDMIKSLTPNFRKKLSEVIIGEDRELTVILSVKDHPASIFLGSDDWNGKMVKLERLMNFMESKEKIPAIVNLTNSEKIVVKFNDKS